MRPARVLLTYELAGAYGGAERYLELLAEGLRERDVRVSALAFAAGKADERAAERLAPYVADLRTVRGRTCVRAVVAAVRATRPDVVHWNFPHPWAFRGGRLLLVPTGRPNVITDHEPMLRDSGLVPEFERWLANRFGIAAVITVSQSSYDAAHVHWRKPPRVRLVRNAVRPLVVERPEPALGSPPRLLFLGRLASEKDPLFALDVVRAMLADGITVRLRIVGTGPLEGAVATAAADLVASGVVTMAGFVPDVAAELANADVLLSCSRHEGGLPLTAQEALSAGVAVVAGDIPPNRELASFTEAVRLAPLGDPQRWKDVLAETLSGLPALSVAARQTARGLSPARMIEETLAIYAEVLCQPTDR